MCSFPTKYKKRAQLRTHAHPHTHRLSHLLHLPFKLSCVGLLYSQSKASQYALKWLYIWFFYCFWFPPVATIKEPCIFHHEIWFWRCFTTTGFSWISEEVGYKVKLHSVTSQVLLQVMPKGILLSFLMLRLQENSVCDWKTNHFLKQQKTELNKRISLLNITVCVCVRKTDEKESVCVVLLTPSVTSACIHRLMHLAYLKLQLLLRKKGIAAGRENESMSSRRKVLIFMSHQSEELSPFHSVYLPVSPSMTPSLPPHLSLSVSLTLPLFSSPPPGSSTLDMRVWICVCVSANIPVSPLRSLSYFHLLLPL